MQLDARLSECDKVHIAWHQTLLILNLFDQILKTYKIVLVSCHGNEFSLRKDKGFCPCCVCNVFSRIFAILYNINMGLILMHRI